MDLPTGTVTFLFTDIEGSTRLWDEHPEAMRTALGRHDQILRDAIASHGGHVFKTGGDSFCSVFTDPSDAVAAALAAQRQLQLQGWDGETELRVRMALHTGPAQEREGDYFGAPLNRVARLLACAHGGQTLLSRATYELVREHATEEVSFGDLGQHSFRDLSHPEHVFQLCHPDLPGDFPPLHSLQAFTHNLPLQLTSFIGRETEIEEIRQLLAETRLLTLTGVGGAGKTRLALQVAAEALDEYGDGVWLTELAALADPEFVPQTVASALRVREQPGQAIAETLRDHLRSKSCLLILDNCEHLLDACARLADALLRSCSEVKVLASSREGLGIAGEATYHVRSLSMPDAAEPLDAQNAAAYESVDLFAQRAESHQPSFELTDANAPAVAEVCRHLDGIPLAIELAAARVRAMPVEQIAARLDDRFRLLTGGSRTALPRQQTLQALIDWSYDLLADKERTLLRRLSVFAGGWTLEAAEAVCAGDGIEEQEVLDLLTTLVDKSLVVYDEAQARYRLLETVRQYARDRLLESEQGATARDRHGGFFFALVTEPRARPEGLSRAQWLERLEAERANLRAVLDWYQGAEDGGEAGLRLAGALGDFWATRGPLSEGRQRLAAALSRATDEPTAVRAWALHAAGWLDIQEGDYAAARSHLEESLAIWRELGDDHGIALSLRGLGWTVGRQGDHPAARALFEEVLTIRRRLGHKGGVAGSLSELGWVAWRQGEYRQATALFEEALAIQRELGNRSAVAGALNGLGLVASCRGDHSAARAAHTESLAIFRELGDKLHTADVLSNLGLALRREGDHAAARALLEESLAMLRELQVRFRTALCLERLAAVCVDQRKARVTARLLGAAEALHEAMGAPLPPTERDEYEHSVGAARTALGEDAFAAAWAEGKAMTLEEAVEYALRSEEES